MKSTKADTSPRGNSRSFSPPSCAPPSDRSGSSNDRVPIGINERGDETLYNTQLLFCRRLRRKTFMYFKTADVAGLRLFYREAGDTSKPTIVLLHGFPSSSHQFHDRIPRLADRSHVIAPDYPGMGHSGAPDPTVLRPTFDDVAMAIDAFLAQP